MINYWFPEGSQGGFYFGGPDPTVPELSHGGELWVPRNFTVETHTHECWEFHLQITTGMRWEAAGRTFTLKAGDFIAMPPHLPHRIDACLEEKQHHYWAGIFLADLPAPFPDLTDIWRRREVIFIPEAETLLAPFRQLTREMGSQMPHHALGLRTSLLYLTLEVTRLLTPQPETSMVFRHPAVQHAKEFLERQAGRNWRLADLALLVNLSPNHLVECFTREVGVPPHQYLLQIRIEQAKEQLRQSDIPITDLALELGFSSSQHFAVTFKRLTGQTAQQYRKAARPQRNVAVRGRQEFAGPSRTIPARKPPATEATNDGGGKISGV